MNNLVFFTTRLPEDVKKQFKIAAIKEGMSTQDFLAKIIKEWIANNETKGILKNENK